MEIKQLMYFVTVAEEGSYIQAARRLNVSQPALSIAVKNLEAEIGSPLFFSFGKKRELTDEGQCLLANAKELIVHYQRTLDDISHKGKNTGGKIRFGLPPLMGACFFGAIIPSFSRAYPNIKVSIIEEGAIKIDQMIADGRLDIALSLPTKRNIEFERHPFTNQQNVVLLNKNHPLASREYLAVAELRDEKFAIFHEDFILHERILESCYQAGFFPKISLLTSQWDFMVEVVSKNEGVSILPRPVYENSAKKDVVAVPLVDSMKCWDIIVIWNKRRYFSRACELFYQHIIANSPPDAIEV